LEFNVSFQHKYGYIRDDNEAVDVVVVVAYVFRSHNWSARQQHHRLQSVVWTIHRVVLSEMIGWQWQWQQLDHMQIICSLLQTDKHTSTSSLDFLKAGCSS